MRKILVKKSTAVLMLIFISLWQVVSCSSTKENFSISHYTPDKWSAVVDKAIPEQQRAAKVKQLGLRLLELASSATEDILDLSAKSVALNENYQSTREDLQKLFSKFVETRKMAFTEYREIIFSMRSEVSAEEWDKLLKL